ncbi:MAG TPA: hypothetical protein VNT54_10690 [Solirubrobacteraceae bacterium]|nr:hypothetical protein [Solirubrobacteraceae bacterium]
MIATDTAALLELVWAAPLAALTVTVAWALVIRGSTRAAEARRDGRAAWTTLHVGVAAIGLILFAAAVLFGLVVMTSKG